MREPKAIYCDHLPGDLVTVANEEKEPINGHVSIVSVTYPVNARYEVSYWHNGKKEEAWFSSHEVKSRE